MYRLREPDVPVIQARRTSRTSPMRDRYIRLARLVHRARMIGTSTKCGYKGQALKNCLNQFTLNGLDSLQQKIAVKINLREA